MLYGSRVLLHCSRDSWLFFGRHRAAYTKDDIRHAAAVPWSIKLYDTCQLAAVLPHLACIHVACVPTDPPRIACEALLMGLHSILPPGSSPPLLCIHCTRPSVMQTCCSNSSTMIPVEGCCGWPHGVCIVKHGPWCADAAQCCKDYTLHLRNTSLFTWLYATQSLLTNVAAPLPTSSYYCTPWSLGCPCPSRVSHQALDPTALRPCFAHVMSCSEGLDAVRRTAPHLPCRALF